MSVANNKRSTDGLTVTKILVGITAFCITSLVGLLTWMGSNIMNDVATIKTQQIISYEHQKNTDSRVARLENETSEHIKEFNKFKIVAYSWYGENEKDTRNRR